MQSFGDQAPANDGTDGDLYCIGEMSNTFNVTLRALRFYESRGLLRPIRVGLARYYDRAARSRLRLILRGKQLGFTLSEIRTMLTERDGDASSGFDLSLGPDQVLAQIGMLQRQRADIERAIDELKATHERLAGRAPPLAEAARMAAAG